MSDTLRAQLIRLAAANPTGSSARRALLDVLAKDDAEAEALLTAYAQKQYLQAAEMASDPHDRALILATTVGRQAKRLGITPEQASSWLQGAYGSVWVRLSVLNPGADLKEVRQAMLKAMR